MFNSCAIFPALPFCWQLSISSSSIPPSARNFNFLSTSRTTPTSLEGQYSNPIATFISANRSNLWLMHQSQVKRDREIILCDKYSPSLSHFALNFDEIFYAKAALNQKQQQVQNTCQQFGIKDKERGRDKSSYISNNFAVMAAHKKYATKIIFHLRNQSIAISHIPYPMSMSYPTAALAQDVVRVCQRWGHADKIQSLWIYAPLQEMKRKKCAKCIDTPTPLSLSLSLLSVGVVCLACGGACNSQLLPVQFIKQIDIACYYTRQMPTPPSNRKMVNASPSSVTPHPPPLRC